MPSLKRNEFIDGASSDGLSNRCGRLVDCLPSCGIHVVASSKFLDEQWYRYIWCWWQAFAKCVVPATISSMLQSDADINWDQLFSLFCFISLFYCVMESQRCLCEYYNSYIYTETSFLTQNKNYYFSFDTTYYLACHTLEAPNIIFNFHWFCKLQSFLWVWCFWYHSLPLFWLSC